MCWKAPTSSIMSQDPDDIGVMLAGTLLLFERTIVLAVSKTLGVEGRNFPAAGHVVETLTFDERRAADSLILPVVDATGGELFRERLPEEFTVGFAEGQQDPRISRLSGS